MTSLVLLHGFTGSPATFDALLGALAPTDPVLRPLLSGHGGAPFPASVVTFDDEVERLAALIAAAVPPPVHLVGYSLGARLALGIARRHPARLGRLTLVSVNAGLDSDTERAARRAADATWARPLVAGDLPGFVAAWERQPLFASQTRLPEAEQAAQRRERLGHSPAGLADALRRLGLAEMPTELPALARSRVPLTVVVGGLDHAFLGHAARIAAARPDAQRHVLEGTGHNVPRESPLALARLLREEETP